MAPLIEAWARAFLLTQCVEVPIYRACVGASLARAFAASALTHPIVWFVFFSPRFEAPYAVRLVSAELFAVLVEAALMRPRASRRAALTVALVANGASVLVGVIARALTGYP